MKAPEEQCNCEQALYYRKCALKLARMIDRYCVGDQEKYGDIYYLAEKISPVARRIINRERRLQRKLKKEGA